MDNKQAWDLLKKYNSGQCTEAEKALIEKSFYEFNEQDIEISFVKLKNLKREIFKQLPRPDKKINRLKVSILISATAAAIVLALYIFVPTKTNSSETSLELAKRIYPIGNAAQIYRSNGQIIHLDKKMGGVKISDSSLAYTDGSGIRQLDSNEQQTISTPRGGEYKIVLSDGTKVRLNAATVLQYPASFREKTERKVRLVSGEAYFEVARDKKHPFIVSTSSQRLTVLGTHFSINAYAQAVKTTLLEGSVKLNLVAKTDSIKLRPGEQSIITGNRFQKTSADLDIETAWINGKIKFRDAGLQSILAEAERWYNIKVVYEDKIPDIRLTGGISRKSSLNTLLKLLQMSGVDFTLSEVSGTNTLTIKPWTRKSTYH